MKTFLISAFAATLVVVLVFLLIHRSAPLFLNIDFGRALLANTLAVILGGAIGVPFGLAVAHEAANRQRAIESASDQATKRVVREEAASLLSARIQETVTLLIGLRDEFEDPNFVPFRNVDYHTIDYIVPSMVTLFSVKTLGLVGRLRHELVIFARKMDAQLTTGLRPAVGGISRQTLVNSIRDQIDRVLELCEATIIELRMEGALDGGKLQQRSSA